MRELKSGFFFLCFSLFVVWESLRVGLWTLHKPGSGFFPFCLGVVLAVLSLTLILKGWGNRELQKAHSRRVVLAMVTIIVYSLILESLGFIVATFLLAGIFFRLGQPRRWWVLIGMSGLVTFLASLIFRTLLKVPLPRGFLGI